MNSAINQASKIFFQFDPIETSVHIQAAALNIHLYCDENFSGKSQLFQYNYKK